MHPVTYGTMKILRITIEDRNLPVDPKLLNTVLLLSCQVTSAPMVGATEFRKLVIDGG